MIGCCETSGSLLRRLLLPCPDLQRAPAALFQVQLRSRRENVLRSYTQICLSSSSVIRRLRLRLDAEAYAYSFTIPIPTKSQYNLSIVNTPVAFFSGGQDVLDAPADAAMVRLKLKNAGCLVQDYVFSDYSHMVCERFCRGSL